MRKNGRKKGGIKYMRVKILPFNGERRKERKKKKGGRRKEERIIQQGSILSWSQPSFIASSLFFLLSISFSLSQDMNNAWFQPETLNMKEDRREERNQRKEEREEIKVP